MAEAAAARRRHNKSNTCPSPVVSTATKLALADGTPAPVVSISSTAWPFAPSAGISRAARLGIRGTEGGGASRGSRDARSSGCAWPTADGAA